MRNTQRQKAAERLGDPTDRVSGLKQSELASLREALRSRRAAIVEAELSRMSSLRDPELGPGDEANQASRSLDESVVLRIADKQQNLLNEIDAALAKFERGKYGLCEGTGEPIGYGRLSVRPWARHGVAYKELLERERREQSGR